MPLRVALGTHTAIFNIPQVPYFFILIGALGRFYADYLQDDSYMSICIEVGEARCGDVYMASASPQLWTTTDARDQHWARTVDQKCFKLTSFSPIKPKLICPIDWGYWCGDVGNCHICKLPYLSAAVLGSCHLSVSCLTLNRRTLLARSSLIKPKLNEHHTSNAYGQGHARQVRADVYKDLAWASHMILTRRPAAKWRLS